MRVSSAVVLIVFLQAAGLVTASTTAGNVCRYKNNQYAYCDSIRGQPQAVLARQVSATDTLGKVEVEQPKRVNTRSTPNVEPQLAELLSDVENKKMAWEARVLEFADEAKNPERLENGYRNFARFLTKMRIREFRVSLAEQDYLQAIRKLNEMRIQQGMPPLPLVCPPLPESVRWAFAYWQDIKSEIAKKWGAQEVDKIVNEYLKAVQQEMKT